MVHVTLVVLHVVVDSTLVLKQRNHGRKSFIPLIAVANLMFASTLTAKDDLDFGLGTWKPLCGIKSALSLSCGSESELSGSG